MQVKKQKLQLDMEQWSGSKLGKEYVKAVYWKGCQGTTEDGMVGWHHWLDGHEFEQL